MAPLLIALGLLASPAVQAGPAAGSPQLQKLHPDFQRRLERLFTAAREAGQPLKIISGYRKLDVARARKGHASWHAFGLALDVNLQDQATMRTALARVGRDRARWEIIGRLAEAEGLVWGGRWRDEEVFHLEWHPGMGSGLAGETLKTLLADAGPDGRHYQRTWQRFGDAPAPDADAAAILADGPGCPEDADATVAKGDGNPLKEKKKVVKEGESLAAARSRSLGKAHPKAAKRSRRRPPRRPARRSTR
ncbi:MAG: M15 family metallopeptidase [bacterium]